VSDRATLPIAVGDIATFRKTVGESDVYLFAGITGDLSPNHVDEESMLARGFPGRIAHGALLVGYMSNASTQIVAGIDHRTAPLIPVSLGYDRIRFLAPVAIGDTIEVSYRVASVDEERRRSIAEVEVVDQKGRMVAVATHILAFVAREERRPDDR
jgi:3-hydroxybutyryl-CoA dehydratase